MASVSLDRATTLLGHYIDHNIPAHLWGHPGIGKSEVVQQIAADRKADLVDIRLSMFDPVDLRGLPTTKNDVTEWMRPAIWPKDDKPTILFFDELDRSAPAVQNAALQIILDRKIGEHTLPEKVRIVAAGNGSTDRVGTNRTSNAGNNRFAHIEVEPDVDAWKKWAYQTNLRPLVIAFVSFRPQLLHYSLDDKLAKNRNAKSMPTPRSWSEVAKFADAPADIQHELVSGLIGEGPAAEFDGFARTFRNLPSLDGVIADPTGAPVPSDPGSRFAISVGLATMADTTNFNNIVTYARRLPDDFSAMLVTDATRRDNALYHTQAYSQFAQEHQDVFQ